MNYSDIQCHFNHILEYHLKEFLSNETCGTLFSSSLNKNPEAECTANWSPVGLNVL